ISSSTINNGLESANHLPSRYNGGGLSGVQYATEAKSLNLGGNCHAAEPKNITITVNNQPTHGVEGTTGNDLLRREVPTVGMKDDGVLQDLFRVVPDGATVERIDITDQEGLEVLRHSTAHVLAQAVQEMKPDAKLGIGPYIEDGFYYDFDVAEAFTPDDLKQL